VPARLLTSGLKPLPAHVDCLAVTPEATAPRASARVRGSISVAAALVALGSIVALAPGPLPAAMDGIWYGVRIGAQLLAAAVILVRVRRHRDGWAPWTAIALAIVAWTVGDGLNALDLDDLAVIGWFCCYALVYSGLALLTRPLLLRGQAAVWLDGLAAALAAAALLIDPVLQIVDVPAYEVMANLAYPVFDFVLAGMTLGTCALAGWRPPPAWRWLGAGVGAMLLGDCVYFAEWASTGYAYGSGAPFESAWALGFLAFAVAAWRTAEPPSALRPGLWGSAVLPLACSGVATLLLVLDHWTRASALAVGLAGVALATVTVRSVLSFRELRVLALTRREALTDELTGLANRRALLRELAAACRAEDPRAALLLCDLDGFKEFNDTLGHEAGDELLREAAERIARAVGAECGAARLGGDEFAVLVPGAGAAEARALAERLRCELAAPLPVAGIEVRVDASVGIALVPDHSRQSAGVLRRADVAMYEAKGARTGVELYDATRDLHSRERLMLAGELRAAVEEGALEVHFQPKVDVADGRVVGAEALVRWPHPERGFLSPDVFLPAAEQAGLMRPLTLIVLDGALAACGRWLAAGRDVGVAVNLSASNLLDASLPHEVAARLAAHGVEARHLTLEVTEGTILANPRRSGEVLAAVRALGVAVSLDDFGTGHSSLSHVKRLPVDELKIDRAFVSHLSQDATDRAIVAAIVRLAHSLGLTVVAEGVEDEAALEALRGEGCDSAQGWLFSRPLDEAAFGAWLAGRALIEGGRRGTRRRPSVMGERQRPR
jgi:diguanylate cyclase (GGDEF)-like protein